MLTDEHAYMKAQIQDHLQLMETDDLLAHWRQADHEAWTDLAFEVMREILVERLGEIPAQESEPSQTAPLETSPREKPSREAASPAEIRKFMRQQTYETMNEMETDELIEIWQGPRHEEWTDLAFEVVQQILWERLGEVPARNAQEREPEPKNKPQSGSNPTPGVFLELNPGQDEPFGFGMSLNLIALHCPDCGKTISEQDHLCPHCGVDLEAPLSESELNAEAFDHLAKAQALLEQGRDFNAALTEVDLALEFTPDSAQAHNQRGLVLDALGKTGLAVLAYKHALELDPGLSDARDNLMDAESELKSRKR